MHHGRRSVLGLALLGAMQPLLAAGKRARRARRAHGALSDRDRARLDAELAAVATDPACELASLAVLAIRDGDVCYEGRFGRRFIDDDVDRNKVIGHHIIGRPVLPDQPVERDTLFRIASVSKMMTTLGLMRLVDAGRVDLDADASSYLGFGLRNPHFPDRPILLRHLLTHTSSLRDDAGYSWDAGTALKDVLVPGARLHGDGRMWATNAGPGDYFTYCNLGFGLVGTLMERVAGERFDLLMQRLLIAPLGLRAAYHPADLAPRDLGRLATLYRKRTVDTEVWDARGPWIAQVDDYSRTPPSLPAGIDRHGIDRYIVGANATPFSPTGGLRISARDLGVVMHMLMAGGVHDGRRIVGAATLSRMFARAWTFDGANGDPQDRLHRAWGLGNQHFPDHAGDGTRLVEGGGFPAVGHLGNAYGLLSVFAFDPARRNGVVVLIGGTSTDPFDAANGGQYSPLARCQERILTALVRRAILVQT